MKVDKVKDKGVYVTPKKISDYIRKHEPKVINCSDIVIYDVWYDSNGSQGCSCDKCKLQKLQAKPLNIC